MAPFSTRARLFRFAFCGAILRTQTYSIAPWTRSARTMDAEPERERGSALASIQPQLCDGRMRLTRHHCVSLGPRASFDRVNLKMYAAAAAEHLGANTHKCASGRSRSSRMVIRATTSVRSIIIIIVIVIDFYVFDFSPHSSRPSLDLYWGRFSVLPIYSRP